MMDLVTAGWFSGDKFVRMHADGTLEVRAEGMVYRAPLSAWIEAVPARPDTRALPHQRVDARAQREPGERG